MNNVLSFIKSLNISSKEPLIVACSGGPDSMFLLHFLLTHNYNCIVAHVNHKMRSESDAEYTFLKSYCEKNNLKFEGSELTGYVSGNFENYARNFRYSFFENLIKKYQAKYLFTAHHGDDLMETIMMRLVRGSSLKGYRGFTAVTSKNDYKIIRPLIYLTKEMIENYNKDNNIPYVIDNSNFSLDYTRNRFRHHILPLLKEEDYLVHEKFLQFSLELDECYTYLEEKVAEVKNELFVENSLDINKFLREHTYMQKRLLFAILTELYPDNLYLIDSNHLKELEKIIKSSKPNLTFNLPAGIKVIKSYNTLKFNQSIEDISEYNLELTDNLELNGALFKFQDSNSTSNFVIRLNSQDITLPLRVRSRKNGDKMLVKNLNGHKKINDIFIDLKVPLEKRNTWPVVVDGKNQILWLPGLKKSNFDIPIDKEYDIIVEYLEKEKRNYE